MSGVGGYGGWRWIFIIEGVATVLLAAASYWIIPDWPETAKFLKADEREMLVRRLAEDAGGARMNKWNQRTSKRIFGDMKIWLG
jgi:peptidoglycan/LPS O-acetylase OafA/YrhL